MRRPRPLTGAALAAFTVAAAVTGFGAGPSAVADTGSGDLYVSNAAACDDTGPGTQAEPFCSVQAAADVVVPGQTVLIDNVFTTVKPFAAVTLTRSGTPAQPVTFEADPRSGNGRVELVSPQGTVPLTLQDVHDVTVRGLSIGRLADAVDVTGSQDVTLDRLDITDLAGYGEGDDVRIDGASSGVTVSRSTLGYTAEQSHAVQVSAGARDITVTTNAIPGTQLSSVALDGTTGASITSNSMDDNCHTEIALTGGTTGTVENNLLASAKNTESPACPDTPVVSVDASSAPGVTADYNDFDAANAANRAAYSWAGTAYTTPADRAAATGDGTHDGYAASFVLPTGTTDPVGIDAANADAPGELPTDINGYRHADDPIVANTGAGSVSYADRGAYESHDAITVPAAEAASPAQHTAPFTATVPLGDATSTWGEPLTYSVDFGDGSTPVTGDANSPAQHTYTTSGAFTETVTVTDADGVTQTRSTPVVAATDVPASPALAAHTGRVPGTIDTQTIFTAATTADFEMASQTIDFGDGTTGTFSAGQVAHPYTAPGVYTATLTSTDVLGRVTTAATVVTVTDSVAPVGGAQRVTATIRAHGTGYFGGSYLGDRGENPVEVRVNATGATDGGWLTAYSGSGTRPSASTLNFPAGHSASNQETVTPSLDGDIAVYNGADSTVTVSMEKIGDFEPDDNSGSYHPTSPVTLLDTRNGTGGITGPVGAGKSVTVQIAGKNGVPANADAVTLDVAENTTKASGSLTVAPDGRSEWGVTASYWAAGESVTNLVTVPLTDGKVTLTDNSSGSANLIAALDGWYSSDATGSGAWPVTPTRVLNTQTGLGETGGKPLKLAAHATLKVKVAGTAGLPAAVLTAADLNLTVSAPTASGWLVAYPDGTTRPTAGAINYTKSHTIAGQAVIKVGGDGFIDLYNPTSTAIDVFADIHGGYLPMS
ncbi:PKD domain-containing protein [Streptomyces sp. SL13]|uniref:PKD domain-containing protein n=1 Tax=Streptantibioticus silvisoli TaxID=2705255 RepID=A0AA90GXI0_9ACTN|nr:PKD domain-containing protein [Streptantibioticus silvisoli]MDI5969948.1 PKD domain-containing protein [Streptantibioticus silvisoli]